MANAAEAMMWAAVFAPSADEIAESIVRKEELRRSEEKLNQTMRKFKQNIIDDLRNRNIGSTLTRPTSLDPERTPIYPHISVEQEADMLENGELIVEFLFKNDDYETYFTRWADETRREAKHPWYIEKEQKWKEFLSQSEIYSSYVL